jgi:AraC-like DNA-binding protein
LARIECRSPELVDKTMIYSELPPSTSLSGFIKCFWTLERSRAPSPSPPEPVLPDGCLEIVFNLADPFHRYHTDGSVETQPHAIIAGQMHTRALIGPSGSVELFGIRFRPAGAFPFFRFPLHELTDRIVDLGQVWPREIRVLEDRINSASNFAARIVVAEEVLLRLLTSEPNRDRLVEAATTLIGYHHGDLTIDRVTTEIGVNGRKLERRFRDRLGVSPKFYSRIVRFQHLLNTVRGSGAADLLGTALSVGYYDQAHLIHEFRELSGQTPGEFFAQEHDLSDVFIAA